MALKRKRSESEFSFSTASPSASPTRPEAYFPGPNPLSLAPVLSLLPGRTMKRFRSNRPPDAEVYRERPLPLLVL